MFSSIKKRNLCIFAALLILIALLIAIYYVAIGRKTRAAMKIFEHSSENILIIDPGHGGVDGGATSVTGIDESIINLEIAEKLEILSALYGIPTVMTRVTEDLDYPSDAKSVRAKKVYDTKNRVEVINGIKNAVLISIHQNIYDSSSISGPQVIFSSTVGSEEFAKNAQEILIAALSPSKARTPAKVPSSIYIMNHINCPAILVECGFLSNYQEDQLLQTEFYQIKIAAALLSAYINSQNIFSSASGGAG